ncbi:MAG: GNAT family N-acetyltransferase [Candidatus Gracilibacteria bacterium]|nr:GNAT family N-acetyltransferase [Candidatus Gracilibacteria bacterium]
MPGDKTDLGFWENILAGEGLGDLDQQEGFTIEKIEKETKKKSAKIIDINSLSLEEIEKKAQVKIEIDEKNNFVIIKTLTGIEIGKIGQSDYKDGDFFTGEHLLNEIYEEFRGKGYGKLLYEIYLKIAKERDYYIPTIEYSKKVSMINLYKKYGFKVISKIVNGEEMKLSKSDFNYMEQIKENFKKGDLEQKLDFTVKLIKF